MLKRAAVLLLVCAFSACTHDSRVIADLDKPAIQSTRIDRYEDIDFSGVRHPYSLKCSAINVDLVEIADDELRLQSDRFTCENRAGKRLGSVVYLIGGPYQSLGQFPEPNVASFMMAGYDVYVPRYSGTLGNTIASRVGLNADTIAGDGEIGVAANELALLVRVLKGKFQETGTLLIVGESAGGYIAAFACALHGACTDSMLFIAPLMQSPSDFFDNFGNRATQDGPSNIAISGGDGTVENELIARKWSSIGFYGTNNWNKSLCDLIAQIPSPQKIKLFYGDGDPRIGIQEVTILRQGCGAAELEITPFSDDRHAIMQSTMDGEKELIQWLKMQ